MKTRRLTSVAAALALFITLFAGCGGTGQSAETSSETPGVSSPSAAPQETQAAEPSPAGPTVSGGAPSDTVSKLSEEPAELSIWIALLMSIENNTDSVNELTAIQKYEQLTNVHINWQEAPSASAKEQFGVMTASGEYSDIILSFDTYYSGGTTAGLDQDVIIALDDYLQHAPNYMSLISSNADVAKASVSDAGQHLAFYGFYDDDYTPLSGPMVRSDWLAEVGMGAPVTYDDYYNVALAFKNKYDCTDPILVLGDGNLYAGMGYLPGYFAGGYGTPGFSSNTSGCGAVGIYQKNGTVHSSLREDGFKEYLKLLNKWYDAGVINRDFTTNPLTQMTPNYSSIIANNQAGIFIGDAVNMNGYSDKDLSPTFVLAGAPDPVVNKGDAASSFGINRNRQQGGTACISTSCKNAELAVRWLDQWFTKEGTTLANYGVENVAYTVGDDGALRYTDVVLKNEKLTQQAATVLYTVIFVPTNNTQKSRFTMWEDDQKILDALKTWKGSTTGTGQLPNVTLSSDESKSYADLASTIQTYAAENVALFINGEKAFSEWDAFVAQLKDLGLEKCVGAYQGALDRYNAR